MKTSTLAILAALLSGTADAASLSARGLDDPDIIGDRPASSFAFDNVRRDDSRDPHRIAGPDRCSLLCEGFRKRVRKPPSVSPRPPARPDPAPKPKPRPEPPAFPYEPPVKPKPRPTPPPPVDTPAPIPLPVPGLLLLGALAGLGALKARRS